MIDVMVEIKLSDVKRTPITNGSVIMTAFTDAKGENSTCHIKVEKLIGTGACCLCYRVQAQYQEGIWHPYVMKEFFPNPMDNHLEIIRQPDTHEITAFGEKGEIQKLRDSFYNSSYYLQNYLSGKESLTDVVVAPTLRVKSAYDNPIPAYILYEMNPGTELGSEFLVNADTEGILQFAVKLADSIHKLHEEKYLYLDVKPSNLLWTNPEQPENSRVMLFDFDSAVDLDKVAELHKDAIRVTPSLTAPELIEQNSFEQDKRFLIRPSLDIFSIGCTLYWILLGEYPGENDLPDSPDTICEWENKIYSLFDTGKLRAQMPIVAQQSLCLIIKKCLSRKIRKRYAKVSALKHDLMILKNTVRLYVDRPAALKEVNYEIIVAHLLYNNPLTPYVKDGVLPVGITGASKIREELLKKLISCCQMLDTELRITIYDEKPEEYSETLCCLWPELAGSTLLSVDGVPKKTQNHRFKQLLAHINICYAAEEQLPKFDNSSVVFLVASKEDNNYSNAYKLLEHWPNSKKGMIAYTDTRGDGYNIRLIESVEKPVKMVPFGVNSFYSNGELSLESELLRLSFGVHLYYYGNPQNSKIREQLWHDFQTNRYAIRSNNRFVLAMQYKLSGLNSDTMNNLSDRFSELLNDEQKLAQLIWLEHRSWSAFMITEGYRCPTMDELEKYVYSGKNNQRCSQYRLHPCLCDSNVSSLRLQNLSDKEWLDADLDEFDELDRTSLRLHRLCRERMKKAKDLLPMYLKILETELSLELGTEETEYWTNQLLSAGNGIMQEKRTSVNQWKETMTCLKETWTSAHRLNDTADELIQLLETLMRPVIDYHRRIDYKKFDLDVLQYIPKLLRNETD